MRAAHHLVDLGHVAAIALLTAGAVALWKRRGPTKRIWGVVAVALAVGAVGPFVLSGDFERGLERLFPNVHGRWLTPAVCVAVSQAVTACYLAGRLCARRVLRWVAAGVALALIAANDFVLKNGYGGLHVLMSSCGAVLVASSLAGARLRPLASRLARARRGEPPSKATDSSSGGASAARRWASAALRPRTSVWVLAAALAVWSVAWQPSSALQVEFLARDTALLFPWLRPFYAPAKVGAVDVPRDYRHWFENRAKRPELAPSAERLLPEGAIVILITVDALRFDLMEPRYERTAPNLHAMRASSVFFSQARSSSSRTSYSLAALFTGRHYSTMEWRGSLTKTLAREHSPRLPELLKKGGVRTVGAMTVSMMEPRAGIVRGLDEELTESRAPRFRSRSDEVAEQLIERLRRQGKGPMFFYTHMLEPHAPYDTYGKETKTKFEAYLVEVSVVDEYIGRIRRAIAELGLKHRTALIVSADHGEGFGEHRVFTHAKALYDVLAHVPMLIEIPGVEPRTVDDFVALMDLGPTVLDLFGLPTPGSWMGETLTPILAGGRGDPTRVLFMEQGPHKVMLFHDGLKLMKRKGGVYEIYDVRRDPEEANDLWEQLGPEGPRRLALLEAYLEAHSKNDAAEDTEEE